MHLVVFSICYNEQDTIAEVLDRIPATIPGATTISKVVISDGSTDATATVARQHGAEVIEGRSQRRLAFRFQQAVDHALGMGADIAVSIDGDMQFDPGDIPLLVEPIMRGEADFVAGDRFTDAATGSHRRPLNMPRGNYWGNRLGARVVGKLTGTPFGDVTCGFRAYNRAALLRLNINTKYTYTQESFQLLTEAGLEVQTIPIGVTYYPGRQSRVVRGFWSFVATSAVNILRSYRDFAPLRFFFFLGWLAFAPGFLSAGFVGLHWLSTGRTSPYTSLGLVGFYLFSLGLLLWVVGLLADMQVRTARNQEKILGFLKEAAYSRDPDGSGTFDADD